VNALTRLNAALARGSGNAQGAFWLIIGSVIFSFTDAAVKATGLRFDPIQMALFRYVVGLVVIAPWLIRGGRASWRTGRLGLHFLRAMVAGVGQAMVYYAVIHLYLADATAVAFTRPLFLTFLAVLLLGETVGWRRWVATAFGFLGVLVMVRPGQVGFDVAWAVALVSAALFAVGIVCIRRLSTTEPVLRILFYYHVFGIALFAVPAAVVWETPDLTGLGMLVLIGVLTAAAMACYVHAFSVSEASVIGPLEYIRLIWAALIGFFMFAEIPSVWTWVGAVMIVASALYIARLAMVRPSSQ